MYGAFVGDFQHASAAVRVERAFERMNRSMRFDLSLPWFRNRRNRWRWIFSWFSSTLTPLERNALHVGVSPQGHRGAARTRRGAQQIVGRQP